MGTRSLTRVFDDRDEVLCMYRQMDGYPSGHGAELVEFLLPLKETNGISTYEHRKIFNGIGCLAAQIVAHFKTDVGGIYLLAPGTKDAGQEYEYEIHSAGVGNSPMIRLFEKSYRAKKKPLTNLLYPAEFLAFIQQEETA